MKLVGRFQVISRIGRGAMASVYRAHDPEIGRDLAIKILTQQFRRDPECAERFLREARSAGSLSHPNIVTIYDVGVIQGLPYIAMELLDGQPLDKAIEARGAFPIEDVLHIGAQLADGLRYAHELGIVHRDIKPSNIMLSADGRTVKILDFGIARVAEGGSTQASSETVRTQVGQVLGTPRYMSPEQALGEPLDGRSDLFSVGAVLYELVTGKPAFNGTSVATLALQITTQPPEPIRVVPECPRGLRFIIDKLLAKRPEKRFANGAQLVSALAREAAAHRAAREEKGRSLPLHLRFTLLASAVVAIVLALGIGAVLDRQYEAMERVAMASGTSISAFVATNTALPLVENASRTSGEADWLPVQAFVRTASADKNITDMMVVDKTGIVRGASDQSLVGSRYRPATGPVQVLEGVVVSVQGESVFRFSRPVTYAGQEVGTVDVSVRKDALQAAAGLGRTLLVGLGALMMAVVLGLSFLAGRVVLSPIRRLNAALRDAAAGNLDFRISHARRDEFGELFDNFNTLVTGVQKSPDGEMAPLPQSAPSPSIAAPLDGPPAVNLAATVLHA